MVRPVGIAPERFVRGVLPAAVSASTPVHYLPMIADVTRVRLSTQHYRQMIMDDLTIAR
jgi:hypothetical protein